MILLDQSLPPGALCGLEPEILADNLPADGLWWRGAEDQFAIDPKTKAITAWHPVLGNADLRPTNPNQGNGQTGAAGDFYGLQCREGIHCGLVANGVVGDSQTVSLAIRYLPLPGSDPRTVLTLNMGGATTKKPGENYLFLSESDGTITIKDDAGLAELTLHAGPPEIPRTVLVSLEGRDLSACRLGGEVSRTQAPAPILSVAANLFLGCRNQRPKLLKTLGDSLISDVWVFPGRSLLNAITAEDRATLAALRRYTDWGEPLT